MDAKKLNEMLFHVTMTMKSLMSQVLLLCHGISFVAVVRAVGVGKNTSKEN